MPVTNNSAPSYIHTGPGYRNATFTTATALDDRVYPYPGPGPPGRLSARSVSLCKSVFYGAFVWARGALNSQNRRFPARADPGRRLGGGRGLGGEGGADRGGLLQRVDARRAAAANGRLPEDKARPRPRCCTQFASFRDCTK